MVYGLGVGHFHAINQDQYLIETAPVNGNICLSTGRPSLPNVDSRQVAEQFGGGFDRQRTNLFFRDYFNTAILSFVRLFDTLPGNDYGFEVLSICLSGDELRRKAVAKNQ